MDEDEEMTDIYAPQWGYGNDADSEGLKKTMWLEVGKEFNCKAIPTSWSCDDWREKVFTHNA